MRDEGSGCLGRSRRADGVAISLDFTTATAQRFRRVNRCTAGGELATRLLASRGARWLRGNVEMAVLDWIDEELATLEALGLRRSLTERTGRRAPSWSSTASTDQFRIQRLSGVGREPRVASAVRRALDECGWGSGASPLVTGRGQFHAPLETALAEFEETEAALLFPSGFAANVGAVRALAGKGDLVLSDAKNHASLIDGCRLSGARVQIYPHGHPELLEKHLQRPADSGAA